MVEIVLAVWKLSTVYATVMRRPASTRNATPHTLLIRHCVRRKCGHCHSSDQDRRPPRRPSVATLATKYNISALGKRSDTRQASPTPPVIAESLTISSRE